MYLLILAAINITLSHKDGLLTVNRDFIEWQGLRVVTGPRLPYSRALHLRVSYGKEVFSEFKISFFKTCFVYTRLHDDLMPLSALPVLCEGNHLSPVDSPDKRSNIVIVPCMYPGPVHIFFKKHQCIFAFHIIRRMSDGTGNWSSRFRIAQLTPRMDHEYSNWTIKNGISCQFRWLNDHIILRGNGCRLCLLIR